MTISWEKVSLSELANCYSFPAQELPPEEQKLGVEVCVCVGGWSGEGKGQEKGRSEDRRGGRSSQINLVGSLHWEDGSRKAMLSR